jgi:hypothetical protein
VPRCGALFPNWARRTTCYNNSRVFKGRQQHPQPSWATSGIVVKEDDDLPFCVFGTGVSRTRNALVVHVFDNASRQPLTAQAPEQGPVVVHYDNQFSACPNWY